MEPHSRDPEPECGVSNGGTGGDESRVVLAEGRRHGGVKRGKEEGEREKKGKGKGRVCRGWVRRCILVLSPTSEGSLQMELWPVVNVKRASRHAGLPGPALFPGDSQIPAEGCSSMRAVQWDLSL